MIHFLKVLWGLILFAGLALLNTLFLTAIPVCIISGVLELGVMMFVSTVILDVVTGDFNPFIIFDLPKLLYFIGKPVIVEKDGEYGIRRGFIVHQYQDWYEWQEKPYYTSWEVVAERMKKIETRKERPMKTKEKVLDEYDLYILSNSLTEEYQEAMKEVQECLMKQKSI